MRLFPAMLFSMVAVLLCGTTVATAADEVDEAVRVIEKLGGSVGRDDERPENPVVSVELGDSAVKDDDLKALAPLTDVVSLSLATTHITGSGLKHLALKKLEALYLQESDVTDEGLKEVSRFTNLKVLFLGGTKIGDSGLKHLANLKKLEELTLIGTKVTDKGMEHLAKITTLTRLELTFTGVGDKGVKQFLPLKKLATLCLWETKVTDAGLKQLAQLTALKTLVLFKTKVTADGIKEARNALPKCRVLWDDDVLDRPTPSVADQ